MASRTKGLTSDVNDPIQQFGEPDFVKALEEKRKSLDQEIAQFKASKEDEYRTYERELRSQKKGLSDKKRSAVGNQGSKPLTTLTDFPKTAVHKVEATTNVNSFSDIQKGTLSAPDTGLLGELRDRGRSHEREIEFQGLFTPTYLPLLESHPRTSNQHSKESPSSPSLQALRSSLEREKAKNHFSSSATLPAIEFDPLRSPPQSAPFSASVPRPNALKERRTSSRSDTSITSLRSSLRHPKTPRSPKHVLFSIDNIVLSPSTSPIAQRKQTAPPIPFSGLLSMPSMATRTFIIDDDCKDHSIDIGQTTSGSTEQSGDAAESLKSTNVESARSTHAGLSSSKAYHRFIESNNVSSGTRSDDFEYIGRDDEALFSFDEDDDMDPHELDATVDDPETNDSDGDGSKANTTFGNSPHAGSLPIEIRWPVKRTPRS